MSIISGFEPNVAGTWGSDLKRSKPVVVDQIHKTSTYKDSYNQKISVDNAAKTMKNSYSKFKSIQDQNSSILPYGNDNPHLQSIASVEPSDPASNNMYTTTSGLRQENKGLSLQRTANAVITTNHAPIAIGRSGSRIEKGVSTSGLLGEKLVLSSTKSTNTLVQRSWMPYDDPAIQYKINGKPTAFMPNDVSLAIGDTVPTNAPKESHWSHGRAAVITGDPFSKAGSRRAGVFMDDFPA